ncbi:MAG: rSAM-associated Gly-rich repeat protein [Pegethrix bostrychoides GSE-TBD4-15B]|uniref:RSAM-associated Gly-rich repeat protein n=1 Tax=Pegethrix bostrychoides GSE-TBD4-15B TaxID=2839662 RepID=A0A951U4M1_9CYAN|nr:rSAM-associated Gly-rich repeat protein [Pegethrix bostrychoides GSE-TBD4-15B]
MIGILIKYSQQNSSHRKGELIVKQTRIGLVSFLLAFAALKAPAAEAHPLMPADSALPTTEAVNMDENLKQNSEQSSEQTVESRLSKLTKLIREREQQLDADPLSADELLAKGFLDGDDRGWRRSRHSGWADGAHGGDFRNSNPWRNGWRDGGSFFNWRD